MIKSMAVALATLFLAGCANTATLNNTTKPVKETGSSATASVALISANKEFSSGGKSRTTSSTSAKQTEDKSANSSSSTKTQKTTNTKTNASTKEVIKNQSASNMPYIMNFIDDYVKINKVEVRENSKNEKVIRITYDYTNKSHEQNGKDNYPKANIAMTLDVFQGNTKLSASDPGIPDNGINLRPSPGETAYNCVAEFRILSRLDVVMDFIPQEPNKNNEKATYIFKFK